MQKSNKEIQKGKEKAETETTITKLKDAGVILSLPTIRLGKLKYNPLLTLKDVKGIKIKKTFWGKAIELILK